MRILEDSCWKVYYRLKVLPAALPPLRERREDIPVLMEHFLDRYCRRRGEETLATTDAVKQALVRYAWPGNVREFEANLISWALKAAHGNKSNSAELLQIKRSTLGDQINRCRLGRSLAVVDAGEAGVAVSESA